MSEKIMIAETIEDIFDKAGELIGKRCSNSSGDSVKVKNPRGTNLRDRWGELEEGMAYKFIMGEYKPKDSDQSFPYVKDFVSVGAELAKKAEKPVSKPVDNRTDDIHTQLATKCASWVFAAYVGQGRFAKSSATQIGIDIGLMAREIKAAMEAGVEIKE